MPRFGQRPVEIPGVGALMPYDPKVADFHRKQEIARTNIRPRQAAIRRISKDLQVYIYSVGPFPCVVQCGSLGAMSIQALPVDKVLLPKDLSVAGPLIIAGVPAEPYPLREGRSEWLEHEAADYLGVENQGLHQAQCIIGCSPQSNPSDDLRPRGVFVSEIPEQQKPPANGASEEDIQLFTEWAEAVMEARKAFRGWAGKMCGEANQAYAKGVFRDVRDDVYYALARILKKTELDCPWLKDTEESSDKKSCIGCGSTMPSGKDKCLACGELQIPEEVYKAKMDRLRAANV